MACMNVPGGFWISGELGNVRDAWATGEALWHTFIRRIFEAFCIRYDFGHGRGAFLENND
jgi:hypothetical protein